ncbi:MAG: hypothetical protein EA393_12875 [Bacteroidetes bacterium]|nr:MAG: hypothetical protein EA393_12875 [Bacteroidota bacterium]
MKSLSVLYLVFVMSITAASQTVRIDFRPGTSDDIDLIIQEGLRTIGMESYVNYHGRSEHKEYDYILKYDETDRSLRFNLYTKNGSRMRISESPLRRRNFHRAVATSLSELFNQRVRLQRGERQYPLRIAVRSHVEKIDSAIYFIRVHTGDYRFIDGLEESFLNIARHHTSNYKTWYRHTKEQRDSQYGLMVTSTLTHELRGIVIGIEGEEPIRLNEPPDVYLSYMNEQNLTPGIDISFHAETTDSTGVVFIARDTGPIGRLLKYTVFINGKWFCNIANARYIKHILPAGEQTLAVQRSGDRLRSSTQEITLDIEPGEIILLKIVQTSELLFRAFLVELEDHEALEIFPNLRVNEHCW